MSENLMKAAIYRRYGPPEVVSVEMVKIPVPADNEVLVKVHYSTLNRTDCGFRSAQYFITRLFSGLIAPKLNILGNEFSGEIVQVGKNVSALKKNDMVFGYNDQNFGAHAEFLVMREDANLALLPAGYSPMQSAPLLEGSHYALCNLRAAKVQEGQDVLVNGATGAIGSAMVQLLKYHKAHVTAVCDTKNVELVRALGADRVIDYKKEDFTGLSQRFDFISDAVGKSSFAACKKLLKPGGVYISTELGKYSANIFLALTTPWLGGRKVLFPLPTINKSDVLFIRNLAEMGKFTPVTDRVFQLDDIVNAHKYVETGMKTGNVLVKVSRD